MFFGGGVGVQDLGFLLISRVGVPKHFYPKPLGFGVQEFGCGPQEFLRFGASGDLRLRCCCLGSRGISAQGEAWGFQDLEQQGYP